MRRALEVRLLGPLEVVDGDRVLTPHRQKPRALLAALALRAGRPVAKDLLVDALWGEEAPRRATDALENYVSQLRKLLGRDVIATRPAGYQLDVAPERIDVVRFERLVAEARGAPAEARAELLREALALVRGPPLADLAFEPFAQTEIGRLEELELAAREELVDVELELGRHVDVVPGLEVLIAAHPFRERPRAQLMLALYRSGRQAEALEAFQDARRMLVDELGIDPGEELQELERAILRQDESLRAPARVERAVQAPDLPLPTARRPTRKTVTVLVSELANLATLADRLDLERLGVVLDRYVTAARGRVERHGGSLPPTAHSADVVALFGVPTAHEDDALRAVRAAAELREAVAELNAELLTDHEVFLETRTGIGTGEVLVAGGSLPTGRPFGEAKNLAARARAGQILLGKQTEGLVRNAAVTEVIKGGEAFRVVELLPGAGGRSLRLDAPMVGRARQLSALTTAFDVTEDESVCQLVTVLGVAGVGKSRLVRELVEALEGRATVLRGRCVPYGEAVALRPLLEALPEEAAATIGATPSEELFQCVRTVLEELVAERPVVLIFDDLQWAEPLLLDLIEDVAATSRDVPLLVVCLARPELVEVRPGWGGGLPSASSISLEPLEASEAERLLDRLLGASDLPDPVREYIVSASGGNPLFLEELLTTLVERDVLRRTAGRWTTTEVVIPMPPSIQALIAARIDRLGDDERTLLEAASVAGRQFTRDLVAELAPDQAGPELGRRLDALVRKELVRPRRGGGFTFRHQLIRDVAYASMPKELRAELHGRLALRLEDEREDPALVAYHREHARRYRAELGTSG